MYYLVDERLDRYYAGQDYSDKRIPVFKHHHSRALGFDSMEEALDYRTRFNLQYLDVKYIHEEG